MTHACEMRAIETGLRVLAYSIEIPESVRCGVSHVAILLDDPRHQSRLPFHDGPVEAEAR